MSRCSVSGFLNLRGLAFVGRDNRLYQIGLRHGGRVRLIEMTTMRVHSRRETT